MMLMRTVSIIVLIFVGAFLLRAEDRRSCEWDSYSGTNQYSFRIGSRAIDKTPIWLAKDEQPPLPARKALSFARAELAKLFTDAPRWSVDSISLSPLSDEGDGRWIYLVTFYPQLPKSGNYEGLTEPMTVPVLMSGVAIEPKISHRK